MPVHSYVVCGCFYTTMEEWIIAKGMCGLQSPKCLPSDPLQKNVADPCLGGCRPFYLQRLTNIMNNYKACVLTQQMIMSPSCHRLLPWGTEILNRWTLWAVWRCLSTLFQHHSFQMHKIKYTGFKENYIKIQLSKYSLMWYSNICASLLKH